MIHLSLWHMDNSKTDMLSFALIPHFKARASLRELRRDVARLKPAPLVLHTTPSLEVSHAALLYDRLCNALPTAFPDTALPLAHFEANLEAPPQRTTTTLSWQRAMRTTRSGISTRALVAPTWVAPLTLESTVNARNVHSSATYAKSRARLNTLLLRSGPQTLCFRRYCVDDVVLASVKAEVG